MLLGVLFTPDVQAKIHDAPIVIPGHQIKTITHYPISMYRIFRTLADGNAEAVPFQIDEINEWGDYVLDQGSQVTAKTGNGIFDLQDELVLMGNDVGPKQPPTKWSFRKPDLTYEIDFSHLTADGGKPLEGAVYVGIYFSSAPPLSPRRYVVFNNATAEVVTSRYRYGFDRKNWLVARRVEMLEKTEDPQAKPVYLPLMNSSTFYMKADLKYFLTLEVNHRSIDSTLEAYKIGPIRSLIRVSFFYKFLKLKFELGMYTEISFFSNAIFLPAIMYNPLDGAKSLNRGSGFYYGMAMKENPGKFSVESNMPVYKESGFFDFLAQGGKTESRYWLTAKGLDRMMYMEITPSKEMRQAGAIPMIYIENTSGDDVSKRNNDSANPLGKSPVNIGLYFDMTKFREGEHIMAFRLYFENHDSPSRLQEFQQLPDWKISAARVRL